MIQKIPDNVYMKNRLDQLEDRIAKLESFVNLMKNAETKIEEMTDGDND